MEALLEYLKVSNVKDDIIYVILGIVILIALITALVAINKCGIFGMVVQVFREIGWFKGSGSTELKTENSNNNSSNEQKPFPKNDNYVYMPQVITKSDERAQSVPNYSLDTIIEFAKSLNVTKEERKEIENIAKEKIQLEYKLESVKKDLEIKDAQLSKRTKQVKMLHEENKLMKEKIVCLDKELKTLKISNHPDILMFDKTVAIIEKELMEMFREIVRYTHISQMSEKQFEEFNTKVILNARTLISNSLRNNYNGTMIKKISDIFMLDNNSFSKTEEIEKKIRIALEELREMSILTHEENEKAFKSNIDKLDKSMSFYLNSTADKILKFVTTKVASDMTVDEIIKNCLQRDLIFDMIIDNETNVVHYTSQSKVSLLTKQFEMIKGLVENIVLDMISMFKNYFVTKVNENILNQDNK